MEAPGRGRPRRPDVRRWVGVARASLAEASRDRITSSAASLAFHWFLALFPALVAALGVVSLAHLSPDQLRSVLRDVEVLLPAQMAQTIDQSLRNPIAGAGRSTAVVLGVLVAVWSSIEAMAALQVGLDVAYEVTRDRGFVGRRLMALPLLAATVVLGGAASALLVLGDPIRSLLPRSASVARSSFDAGWAAVRWAGAVALVMLLLSVYYSIGPNHERFRLRLVSVGAVAATAGWIAASAGLSLYLDHFAHESRSYGTLAGVAALLLWLFLTGVVVLLGAEINCELDRPSRAEAGA